MGRAQAKPIDSGVEEEANLGNDGFRWRSTHPTVLDPYALPILRPDYSTTKNTKGLPIHRFLSPPSSQRSGLPSVALA